MTTIPKSTLKSYFETGKIPTEQQFAELVDATYNEGVGEYFFRFLPEEQSPQIKIGQLLGYDMSINNVPGTYRMSIQIPPEASSINTLRLTGGVAIGGSNISEVKLYYFSDVDDPTLPNKTIVFQAPTFSTYQYELLQVSNFQFNTGTNPAPNPAVLFFEELLIIDEPLNYNNQRLLTLEIEMEGLNAFLPVGVKFE